MAETSALHGVNSNANACWTKVIESKWSDALLITGFVALLIIGIVASTGAFNAIGTTNAAYLSYGLYGGASLFLIAEIVKVAANCYKKACITDSEQTDDIANNIANFVDLDGDLNAQITGVKIDSACAQSSPCQHLNCAITFSNGRLLSISLDGDDVRALALVIDRNKFVYDYDTQHNPLDHFGSCAVSKRTAKSVIAAALGITLGN